MTLPSAGAQAQHKKLAVCSHPWSRLGGSMFDPVLHSLVNPLSRLGYHVLLFNARGVGGSSGWASFTAFQEAEDLRELVTYLIEYLEDVQDVALIVRLRPPVPTAHPVPHAP